MKKLVAYFSACGVTALLAKIYQNRSPEHKKIGRKIPLDFFYNLKSFF